MKCRIPFRYLLAFLFFSILMVGKTPTANANQSKTKKLPNIVIVLADDLGYGDLACYGHPNIKSPHLDAFAKQGMRFTQCYAGSAVCSPSRSAIVTGRTPYRNGVFTWIPAGSDIHLRTSEISIATLLRRLGYATCHVGKWHLNGKFNSKEQPQPNDHGYEWWMATQNNAAPSHENPKNFVRNGEKVGQMQGYSALLIADEAIQWLEKHRDKSKPFLLSMWFHEPHLPIKSAERFKKEYPDILANDPQKAEHHGNVSQMDAAFGKLMQALDEMGLAENTIVIFTSDNGPEGNGRTGLTRGSTGGLRGRKRSVYGGGITVPGIIRWPGHIQPGSVCETPIIGSDIFPTICAITGMTPPKDRVIDGVNITPLFSGKTIERPIPMYWRCNIAPEPLKVAMRKGDWKILGNEAMTKFELYNLKNDPKETTELSDREPERFQAMKSEFVALNAQIEKEGPDWWKNYNRNKNKNKNKNKKKNAKTEKSSEVNEHPVLFIDDDSPMPPVEVEGQPLAENARRLLDAMQFLGQPFPEKTATALKEAIKARDWKGIQETLDPHVLVNIPISPEARVKAQRGSAKAELQQGGYTPVIFKVLNESTVTAPLRMQSPQAGAIFSGGAAGNQRPNRDRFLDVEVFRQPPMTKTLSGLQVEYVIGLIHSSEAGKREATLKFDIGQGTQDLGFRAEVPILFNIKPAMKVKLTVLDYDGTPTVGRFTFRDKMNRVYPPRAKRLAPDFFFHDQIYRKSGDFVLLPPGTLTMEYCRGPEYRLLKKEITITPDEKNTIEVKMQRWINPMDYGFYNGDHHIHAAGCAHYTSPTEGVFPEDMFLHVKGEGLNVGCNLTWGPCFEFQRQFFGVMPHKVSEPMTVLKYDIEVSGFGSQALGHVCLLNLKTQNYPGSSGTKEKGWPTWTTPLMRWAKAQGAYTGYAHSASGLQVNPNAAAGRLLFDLDKNKDKKLSPKEAAEGLVPFEFQKGDRNRDGFLSQQELVQGIGVAAQQLPNLAIPELNGIGAQEIFVTSAQGLCDFISAMDTQRVPEWNCWYHIMNCGFPLKVSGETDFPCISGSRVGEGRVYVQLGKIDSIDFGEWSKALADGHSYVSDGYAHALEFKVNGKTSGEELKIAKPQTLEVTAKMAFASEMPLGTAKGGFLPKGKTRKVELIHNGKVIDSRDVPADDQIHNLKFSVPVQASGWLALRHFPQMHTNPVNVIVDGKPIRASRKSALWCANCIEQLWRARSRAIAEDERPEAERTFQRAIADYRRIAREAPEGS